MKLLLIEDDTLGVPRVEIDLGGEGLAKIVKAGPSLPALLRSLYEAEAAVVHAIETGLKSTAPAECIHCPNCGVLAGVGTTTQPL